MLFHLFTENLEGRGHVKLYLNNIGTKNQILRNFTVTNTGDGKGGEGDQ